jgi:hypothetical protein
MAVIISVLKVVHTNTTSDDIRLQLHNIVDSLGLESAGKAFIIILLNDILARENSDEIFAKAKEEVHKYCVARNALKNNIYSVGPNQYKICVATA